jgi:hypothetical protein
MLLWSFICGHMNGRLKELTKVSHPDPETSSRPGQIKQPAFLVPCQLLQSVHFPFVGDALFIQPLPEFKH